MPIRGVIFDFYGTLAESTGAGLAWADLFSEIGHTLSHEAIDRLWNEGNDGVEHDEHSQSRDHYVAWQQTRLRQIIAESGVPEGDDDLLFARMTERPRHAGPRRVPGRRARCLAELRDRGLSARDLLELGLGPARGDRQRGPDRHGRRRRVVGVGRRAQAAPAHLRRTCWSGSTSTRPTCLFVGDTWTCDVEGPRRAGMRPVYLRRPHFGVDRTRPEDADDTGVTHAEDLTALRALPPTVDGHQMSDDRYASATSDVECARATGVYTRLTRGGRGRATRARRCCRPTDRSHRRHAEVGRLGIVDRGVARVGEAARAQDEERALEERTHGRIERLGRARAR